MLTVTWLAHIAEKRGRKSRKKSITTSRPDHLGNPSSFGGFTGFLLEPHLRLAEHYCEIALALFLSLFLSLYLSCTLAHSSEDKEREGSFLSPLPKPSTLFSREIYFSFAPTAPSLFLSLFLALSRSLALTANGSLHRKQSYQRRKEITPTMALEIRRPRTRDKYNLGIAKHT
jgi:hypothetical protein